MAAVAARIAASNAKKRAKAKQEEAIAARDRGDDPMSPNTPTPAIAEEPAEPVYSKYKDPEAWTGCPKSYVKFGNWVEKHITLKEWFNSFIIFVIIVSEHVIIRQHAWLFVWTVD